MRTKDFVRWSDPVDLTYVDSPNEHLYTNQIQPYYRAPHILMGFPMRHIDRGWSEPLLDLPGLEERMIRAKSRPRYGTAVTDGLFMTSRDGRLFKRWGEAFLRPGPREQHSHGRPEQGRKVLPEQRKRGQSVSHLSDRRSEKGGRSSGTGGVCSFRPTKW
jgi:hypothetical protein